MPSSTVAAAAEAAAPPLRRRRRRPSESVTLHLQVFRSMALPSRDWAAGLPPELLSCIFHRLDHVQIMLGADKVCRSWRRAARDEPELWRRIDMRGYKALSHRNLVDLNQMAVDAVRRSHGQCQAFAGEGNGLHDDFILFLANQAPLLKRLNLISCRGLSGQGFMVAIKGLPQLVELHLRNCGYLQHAEVLEDIAKECPRLKYLGICSDPYDLSYGYYGYGADGEAMAIAKMQELRSLQLITNGLTNQGLAANLDNCLHLKSLDILNCYNIEMSPEMEARIKAKKLLINYSSDDGRWGSFDDERGSNTSECSPCLDYPFSHYGLRYKEIYPRDEKEAMVISAVRELRSLELHRNDLTSKGVATVLDKCPHLEAVDVWNCLNIARNNNALLRARKRHPPIKTKKLTKKLLMDRSNHNVFNPEGLDMRNCHNLIMNSCHGRAIIMDNTLGARYKRLKLRKWTKKYHRRTKKMKARTEEEYLPELPGNVDYMDFEGAEFGSYPNPGYQYMYNYHYCDWELDDVEF